MLRNKAMSIIVIFLFLFNLFPQAVLAEPENVSGTAPPVEDAEEKKTGYEVTAIPLSLDITDGSADFEINIKIYEPEIYERITVTAKPCVMKSGGKEVTVNVTEPIAEWLQSEWEQEAQDGSITTDGSQGGSENGSDNDYVDLTFTKSLKGQLPGGKWTGNLVLEVEVIEIFTLSFDYSQGEAGEGSYPDTYTIEDNIVVPNPTREGYNFTGWSCSTTPDAEPVTNLVIPKGTTGDMSFTANWVIRHLSEYTWSEIKDISDAGKAERLFGECFDMTKADLADGTLTDYCHTKDFVYDGTTYHAMIAAFDHDVTATGTAGMSFITYEPFPDARMNDLQINDGGWAASDMRNSTLAAVHDGLPQDMTDAISEVEKSTAVVKDGVITVEKTMDKLWLPSQTELYGAAAYDITGAVIADPAYTGLSSIEGEGEQYSIFAGADTAAVMARLSLNVDYWIRSIAYETDAFCIVKSTGDPAYE